VAVGADLSLAETASSVVGSGSQATFTGSGAILHGAGSKLSADVATFFPLLLNGSSAAGASVLVNLNNNPHATPFGALPALVGAVPGSQAASAGQARGNDNSPSGMADSSATTPAGDATSSASSTSASLHGVPSIDSVFFSGFQLALELLTGQLPADNGNGSSSQLPYPPFGLFWDVASIDVVSNSITHTS
jgi:hypothetical protein